MAFIVDDLSKIVDLSTKKGNNYCVTSQERQGKCHHRPYFQL
jgi:hypothetical protein